MNTVTLRLALPCQHGRVRLEATPHVPVERYERQCPKCHLLWHIERRSMAGKPGMRFDAIDWWLGEAK